MDPISLAALISLVGAGAGAYSSKNAADVSGAGLQFQREQAQQANRLGTAGHSDAFGDTTTYDPATNTWNTTLSPTQKAIADAQQSEQYKTLTSDAARNRAIKNLQYQMAGDAGKDYNTALAGFRYDQPASQGAIQDKLTTLMTNADNAASSSNESLASRELLRQGRGGDLNSLVKTIQDNRGKALAGDQLKAYTGSLGEEQQLQQQHQSKYLPALQQSASTVAAAGGAPVDTSSIAPLLMQGQQQNSQQALNALLQSNKEVGDSYHDYATTLQKGAPNLSGIASLYKAIADQKTGKGDPYSLSGSGKTGRGGSSSYDDPWAGSSIPSNYDPNLF